MCKRDGSFGSAPSIRFPLIRCPARKTAWPFWSPDSRFVGFFAEGKLKKIDILGGTPQTLCDAARGTGGAWNRDGVIVFARNISSGLYRVSAEGGKAEP